MPTSCRGSIRKHDVEKKKVYVVLFVPLFPNLLGSFFFVLSFMKRGRRDMARHGRGVALRQGWDNKHVPTA